MSLMNIVIHARLSHTLNIYQILKSFEGLFRYFYQIIFVKVSTKTTEKKKRFAQKKNKVFTIQCEILLFTVVNTFDSC